MKRLGTSLLLALLAIGLLATPVYADTADPDDTPTIVSINAYRNLIETGDMLIVIYANIPYSSTPSTPVTDTFIWRLIDTDGTTELGSTIGSNYNDDGYGYNVYSLYFSASTFTSLGIIWETVYTIRLSGNPAVFDTPPTYNFTLNADDYSTQTAQAAVQTELAARVILTAEDLETKWGLTAAELLLTQSESGTVLSTFGEAFFRGAIFGLQAMAPTAFSVVIRVLDIVDRAWTDGYSDNLTNQWTGTWVETAQNAGQTLFGTSYDLLSIIMLLAMAGGLVVGNVMVTGDAWNGLIDVALISVVFSRLGMIPLGFVILIAAGFWFYIGAKIWFGLIK